MADKALNELNIKSDSLPDNWLVTLVNPTTGAPSENMTIARFIELFTNKQPVATDSSNGLMAKESVILNRMIYNVRIKAGGEYKIPKGSGFYGLYYISAVSDGLSALYRTNHYQGGVLISGDNIFSDVFEKEGKVSIGVKSGEQAQAYIINKMTRAITFSLRIL